MNYITNLVVKDELITFDLHNKSRDVKICLANAIRRTIISDIPCYAIDENEVIFHENTSVLNNEFLKHRLSLIPIISDLKDIDYGNLVISCNKENNEENIINVYAKDFIVKDSIKNEIYDFQLISKYPTILFAKLKYGQNISFDAKLKINNLEFGGSVFSPVSICIYTFKIDENMVNETTKNMNVVERTFFTQDVERLYQKNDNEEPIIYQFSIEGNGFYDIKNILFLGLEYLIKRIKNVKENFRNKKSKKISLVPNEENPDFFDFLIDHENETIGNLLSSYLTYQENVFFSGYVIEHPLNNNIILRIKLKNENTLENVILLIEKTSDFIINLINKFIEEIELF